MQYIDKNHGGTLIIWDRIFGTFAEEKEKVEYGILHPEKSKNPFRILTNPWINLYRQLKSVPGWKNRARTL